MKKQNYLGFYLFLFLSNFCLAQSSPNIEWQNALGGSEHDAVYAVQNTPDGGYIVAGRTQSNDGDVSGFQGAIDMWITKININGELEWAKTLGGSNNDIARSIQPTTDGGYIVAGQSNSTDGDITMNQGLGDLWLVKLNDVGEIQWEKTLGGSNSEWANFVQLTPDGGYILAGATLSNDGDVTENKGTADAWVIKTNSVGDIQWQKTFGGSEWDIARAIYPTPDGGYVLGGSSESSDGDVSENQGIDDFWIVKLSSNGSIQWENSFGGSESDIIHSIQLTPEGGYIVVGYTMSNNGDVSSNQGESDYWVVKLNSTGDMQWEKTYGGSSFDRGYTIESLPEGGFVMVGFTFSNDGDVTGSNGSDDIWLIKINDNGEIIWQKAIGGSSNDFVDSESLKLTPDGGYVVAGYTASNDGDVSGNNGFFDFWVVKLSPDQLGIAENQNQILSIYPNPVNDILTINSPVSVGIINIYSITGVKLKSQKINSQKTNIDMSEFSSGIYLLNIESKGVFNTEKVIKI